MKSLLTLATALLLAVLALPLREWSDGGLQRLPVNRWLWIRSEIVNTPRRQIDYAFTGSSAMLSAIRPRRIVELAPGATAFNFAHFAWGHDADYFVARPLLERHDVDTLVIEIPRTAPTEPHGETVRLVGARELGGELAGAVHELSLADLLSYSPALKQRVERLTAYSATALFAFPRDVLARALAWLTGAAWEYEASLQAWHLHYGYAPMVSAREPVKDFRERHRQTRHQVPDRPARVQPGRDPHPMPGSRNDYYLGRLRALAEQHGTRLVFLWVPRWKARPPSRELHRYYSDFGEVVIPDLEALNVLEYYRDPIHIYRQGTELLSEDVLRLLREGTAGTPYNDLY